MADDEVILPADCLSIQEIGTAGGAFLVITWLVLLITALFMVFKAVQPQTHESAKKYYFLNAFICGVATYSYFAMFSGMGWETIEGCRQFFYIRLIEFAVTGGLVIFSLGLLAQQDYPTILAIMGANVGMVTALYLGSVATVPLSKWLWFLISLTMFVPIVYSLLREFRQSVLDKSDQDRIELYGRVSLLIIISWSLYPAVWILSVGVHAMGISVEVICYCVLDIFSKVAFCFVLVNIALYDSVPADKITEKEYV